MIERGSSQQERSFGLSVGSVCGLISAVLFWKQKAAASMAWGTVAFLLLIPALTRPSLLRIPSAIWWRVARVLGWFNTRVLLSAFFFLVLTPAGLIARATGWDPLRRKHGSRRSHWVPYPKRPLNHYERMY